MTNAPARGKRCDRRDFLQIGGASVLGLTLADLLGGRARGEEPRRAAKSMIVVWLAGGPATIDMWDMKPDAPGGIRGEFQPIQTSLAGVSICEHLPEMAKQMDRATLIRSVSHTLAEHGPGTELVITGHPPTPALEYPSLSAVGTQFVAARSGVPSYVTLGSDVPGGSGFLGAAASPFRIADGDLAGKGSRVPVDLPGGFTTGDLARRTALLARLDGQFAQYDRANLSRALSSFEAQAVDILRSNKTRQALDLESEPEASRTRYGNAWAGRGLLAARRLVEAGVGFVTVAISGWDTHANNFGQLRTVLLPQLDRALAALLVDLDERGLARDTLVYCAGEFGRTPLVNGQAGRDHWSRSMSVLVAAGGLPRGCAYGATDDKGMEPTADRCSPADVNATLLSLLGVSSQAAMTTRSGRPITAFGDGAPIKSLVG